jgi:predicted transcriptional regulator
MLPITAFEHDELSDVEEAASLVLNPRRITIIELLRRHGSMSMRTLTERMAERESGEGYTAKDRKRVFVAAHQHHLPTLERAGVVSWGRDTVAPGKNFEGVYQFSRAVLRAYATHLK